MGSQHLFQSQLEAAASNDKQALALYTKIEDDLGRAHTVKSLGDLQVLQDQPETAAGSQLVLLPERHRDLQGLGVAAISVDHLPALGVFDAALALFPFPLAADWNRGICRGNGVQNEEQ